MVTVGSGFDRSTQAQGSLRLSFARQVMEKTPNGDSIRSRYSTKPSNVGGVSLEELTELRREMSDLYNEDEKEGSDSRISFTSVSTSVSSGSSELFQKTMCMSNASLDDVLTSHRRSSEATRFSSKAENDSSLYSETFESMFAPNEMRCLALVAHNHMKPAMKEFVKGHKEILRKFRLTGTNTTITMLKEVFGDDASVQYGPAFNSGPLGGDAELCALMCLEDLGGMFFFMDPLSAHPHQADIDSLVRLANVHNILTCINPCSAHAMSFVLKSALKKGRKDQIPSFFHTLESPGVAEYQAEQKLALELASKS